MANITSTNIKVFPVAKNRTGDPGARLFYEKNIANMVRQLIDTTGFVVNPKPGEALSLYIDSSNGITADSYLEFNLYGYNFMITKDSQLLTNVEMQSVFGVSGETTWQSAITKTVTKTVYVVLNFDTNGEELAQDSSTTYGGLNFTAVRPADTAVYMPLCTLTFERISESDVELKDASITADSYMKLSPKSLDLQIDFIDGFREL